MNENRWKYIPEGAIHIDISNCKYADQIHKILKESFGFPDYYGANWSAFWDCLRDLGISEENGREVIVYGLDSLPSELKDYTQKMVEIMHRAERKYPLLRFVFRNN